MDEKEIQQPVQEPMTPNVVEPYEKHYTAEKFWGKIKTAAESAGAAAVYTALLLYYVMRSPQTSLRDKALIAGALGYFIFPFDLIADILPGIGFTDDAAAMTAALITVASNITPEVESQAKDQFKNWFPNVDDKVLKAVVEAVRAGAILKRRNKK